MKKILILILALLMLVSMAACGSSSNSGSGDSNTPAASTGGNHPSGNGNASQNEGSTEEAKLTGKLSIITLDDRDPSVLRGVRIVGNQAGTEDGINGKASSLTDVRCIFELNEWIEFYPDTDAEYDLRVWVLKHRGDEEYYNTCKFSDLMPDFISYCDLHYPADEENPDEYCWGSFYLNPEDCDPGYYDFVFTCEGKAISVLQTRFYGEAELAAKSDAELESLMHE